MPTKPQTPFTKFDAFILIAFLLFCAAGVIVPKVRERREAAEKARIEEASQLAAAPQSTAFPWLAAARLPPLLVPLVVLRMLVVFVVTAAATCACVLRL